MIRQHTHSFYRRSLLTTALLLPGCTMTSYLSQGAAGQLDLMDRAVPIPVILRQELATPKLRYLLQQIEPVKRWAAERGLQISDNYRTYAPLPREAAVWVVTASAELAFEERAWEFPLFGSFPYLGFFDPHDAAGLADELRSQGWDVDVRGASAYSTLGWFADPVLSTMLSRDEEVVGRLIAVVLHESVHATHYVTSQGPFSESLALFVEEQLTPRYLAQRFGPASNAARAYAAYRDRRANEEERLFRDYRTLAALYASDLSDVLKRQRKREIYAALEHDLEATRKLNNATLIDFRTYRSGRAEFAALLETCGGDWRRFLAVVQSIGKDAFSEEQQSDLGPVILPLAQGGCKAP